MLFSFLFAITLVQTRLAKSWVHYGVDGAVVASRTGAQARSVRLGPLLGHVLDLVLTAGALLMVVPFLWMISTSLKTEDQVFVLPPLGSRAIRSSATTPASSRRSPFGRYIVNSTFVSVAVMAGSLLTSAISAFAFARLTFWGRDKLFALPGHADDPVPRPPDPDLPGHEAPRLARQLLRA